MHLQRDDFAKRIDDIWAFAVALHGVTSAGTIAIMTAKQPSSAFKLVGSRGELGTLDFDACLASFRERRHHLEEMTHAQMVAGWNHYLDVLYLLGISGHLSGKRPCTAFDEVDLRKLKLSDPKEESLHAAIAERLRSAFAFADADSRLRVIQVVTGAKLQAATASSLRKHIAIRNLFQHHGGRVREDDLARLGVKHIEMPGSNGTRVKFGVNDQVELGYDAVHEAADIFRAAGAELVPP